ncbi:MAG TPA: hypothetical protein PKI71_15665 [Candidatus Rifleibacterium sp.]|nr:hypothetical protein [Candidatus Rifleibacterium sp.]
MNKLRPALFVCLLLAAAIICGGRAAVACSDYVHLWRPVTEERSAMCGAEGVAHLLRQPVSEKISGDKMLWDVGLSPDTQINASFVAELQRAVEIAGSDTFRWTADGSPFAGNGESRPSIWLDFVKPERLVYIWRDENRPPFAMFRTGELDTAQIRVLVMSAERQVLYIDEVQYMFLLESDIMLPTWLANGGAWFRRVSLKTFDTAQRHEWTLSVPSDMEDVNTTPSDIRRFYFGDVPDDRARFISNYQ